MKLSEILNEARAGSFIFNVDVCDVSKVIANATGILYINSTVFQQKFVPKRDNDEVVPSLNRTKQTNISELKRTIIQYKGVEMHIRIGSLDFTGIIKIDK